MADPSPTPNLHLQPVRANRNVWADIMNGNLSIIDAIVGTYFIVQNLQGSWQNSTTYQIGMSVVDIDSSVVYQCQVGNISSNLPTTFAEERAAHPTYWTVYSSPARSRGVWLPGTSYALNDFVVNGPQYAICVQTHISSTSFATDLASGKWSVLVDLSSVGSTVLPVPGGAGDGNKTVTTTGDGTGYTIRDSANMLVVLGATDTGRLLFTAADDTAARSVINAQIAGSYQPLASALSTLSGFSIGSFADDLLACNNAAAVISALALSVLATTTPATGIATFLANPTSANLLAALTTKTGTGNAVFSADPVLTGNVTVPDQAQAANSNFAANAEYVDRVAVQQTVIAVDSTYRTTAGAATPADNTIPTSTEGDEYTQLAVTITPKSATSILEVEIQVPVARGGADTIVMSLFRDAGAAAIKAVAAATLGANVPTLMTLTYRVASGAVSATTFHVRIGSNTPSALYFNGISSGGLLGGVSDSHMIVREYGI